LPVWLTHVDASRLPRSTTIRIDGAAELGSAISPLYDSMIAKLIARGADRTEAIARMRRALAEFAIQGIKTTLPLHRRIMEAPEFVSGDYTIHWLERFVAASVS